jgi:hypothetical protein
MPNSSSFPHDPNAMAQRLMQSAHTRDGLPEIAVGLSFLFASGLIYAQATLRRESIGFEAAVLAFAFLFPLLCLGSPWALKWVRRRYLIERLGYVQHKPIARKQIGVGIMLGVLMAVTLFAVVTRVSRPDGWLLAGTGLFGGALAALGGRLPRFVIGGALMAVTGLVVAFSGVSLEIGFAILFGFQGLVTLIAGGLVFLRFIRQPIETGE